MHNDISKKVIFTIIVKYVVSANQVHVLYCFMSISFNYYFSVRKHFQGRSVLSLSVGGSGDGKDSTNDEIDSVAMDTLNISAMSSSGASTKTSVGQSQTEKKKRKKKKNKK